VLLELKMQRLIKCWLVLMVLLATSSFAFGQTQHAGETQQLLDELVVKIQARVSAINASEVEQGAEPATSRYSLYLPASNKTDLGLSLDVEKPQQGFRVVAVSPNSLAERLKIAKDDVIQVVNHFEVNGGNKAEILAQLTSLESGALLSLSIQQKSGYNQYTIVMDENMLPAASLIVGKPDIVITDPNSCLTQDCMAHFVQMKKQADKGSLGAMNILATMYYYGYGTQQSTGSALVYFHNIDRHRRFIKNAFRATTRYQMGLIYLTDPQYLDVEQAFKYLTKSAKANNADAALLLGMMYLSDDYGGENLDLANKWLAKAYENDHAYLHRLVSDSGLELEDDTENFAQLAQALKQSVSQQNGVKSAINPLDNKQNFNAFFEQFLKKTKRHWQPYYRRDSSRVTEGPSFGSKKPGARQTGQ